MSRLVALVLLVFACARCSEGASSATGVPTTGPGTGILFVGNSLTYTNDLPGLVAGLAKAVGHPVPVASVAFPDFSLADHWNQGDAVRAISRGGWSFVVLQQGPSSLDDSRVLLRRDAARFDARIRAIGARTALFSVWPESTRPRSCLRQSKTGRVEQAVSNWLGPGRDAARQPAAWARCNA